MKIKRFEFNMFPVNCYVLADETQEAVIIDAGCYYPEEQRQLKSFITTHQLTVRHLLNTHLHADHLFGNAFAAREFGVSPEASQRDEFLLAGIPTFCKSFGFPLNEKPAALGHYISDGETIRFGNTELKAISVPGHSPGSLVYYCEKEHCMFSGDTLFKGSIGRADLEGGNFDDLRENIMSRLFVLPDNTVVYPGHGNETSIGNEKKNNPFFR
ncbi:MAG TPA: MBL fold metallo-hydrolase [Candidatus Phocaeicola excrementigallinarum]|nr:MBL fold metallo-hydrolase [Candidatus Phocaeicola excrementigallinarum]